MDGHVKFADDTHFDPDTLHVTASNSQYNLPEAHLGILKNHHTYSADLPIKHSLGSNVTVHVPNYNLYVRVTDIQPTVQDGESYTTLVKLEIKTIKEGRIREKIILTKNDDEVSMEILVTAQVMETGQGNPILKGGVHLISHDYEDESEWPGHSSH